MRGCFTELIIKNDMQRLYLSKFRFVDAFNSCDALERCDLRFHDFWPRQRVTNIFMQCTLVFQTHISIFIWKKENYPLIIVHSIVRSVMQYHTIRLVDTSFCMTQPSTLVLRDVIVYAVYHSYWHILTLSLVLACTFLSVSFLFHKSNVHLLPCGPICGTECPS